MIMPAKGARSEDETRTTPAAVLAEADRKMNRTIEALRRDLASLRTGKASPALIENISVEYYGVPTPLNQLASISVPDARAILLHPYDKQALREIEKSLMKSELGFNPSNDGNIITLPIPPLSQERRQEIVRLLRRKIEEGKTAIRNVRRDGNDTLRKMERDKVISQDDSRRAQEQLQKTTDAHVKTTEQIATAKEAEIMQV
jgi:ribosome recycling factor